MQHGNQTEVGPLDGKSAILTLNASAFYSQVTDGSVSREGRLHNPVPETKNVK